MPCRRQRRPYPSELGGNWSTLGLAAHRLMVYTHNNSLHYSPLPPTSFLSLSGTFFRDWLYLFPPLSLVYSISPVFSRPIVWVHSVYLDTALLRVYIVVHRDGCHGFLFIFLFIRQHLFDWIFPARSAMTVIHLTLPYLIITPPTFTFIRLFF